MRRPRLTWTARRLCGLVAALVALLAPATMSAGEDAASEDEIVVGRRPRKKLRVTGEAKINYRYSDDLAFRLPIVVPPDFFAPGEDSLFLRTVDPGSSLEVSNLAVQVDYAYTPQIAARARVHVLDLHSRNPTSSGERVFVREAWLRFGSEDRTLKPIQGSSAYAVIGLAPRFSKQLVRQLESYGLWGTAVGRFEQVQLQGGGTVGTHFYWRAHIANRNPLFFRDPNALAGDHGTDERVPGAVDPTFESGFPILYDTLPTDVTGEFEWGAGIGVRAQSEDKRNALDLLGWYFKGKLAEAAPLRETFYEGDLDVLDGAPNGVSLATSGDDKIEYGVNVTGKVARLRLFAQLVRQELAGLERHGVEAEVAWRIPLGGLFASGDRPVFNWVNLAFRYSRLDNDFSVPPMFVAPSFGWDWRKYDIGVRVGLIRNVDLTVEYARHEMVTARGTLHPDEALVTLRAGF